MQHWLQQHHIDGWVVLLVGLAILFLIAFFGPGGRK